MDEDSFVQAYNDQIDADELALSGALATEPKPATWKEIHAILRLDEASLTPSRANSPEIDPAE